jgi:transposase
MPAAQWARTLPIGKHGITAPTLWARLGDAPGRWESFRHLQAHAGAVPVTKRSGKQQRVIQFRFACDKSLRYVVDQVAFLSMLSSEWARAYYDQQRARGHAHRQALRALGAKWLKIIFVMWQRRSRMTSSTTWRRWRATSSGSVSKKSLDMNQRKSF